MSLTTLVDAPGPKARARQRAFSVIGAVALTAVLLMVYRRLDQRGQLEAKKWEVFADWNVVRFYLVGLGNTLRAAALASVLALLCGVALALGRLAQNRLIRWLCAVWVESFRAAPLILLMYFSLFALPKIGITFITSFRAVVLGLVLYNSAVLAEIFRAGIQALPAGQSEAAVAIGLRYWQSMRHVIVPQAVRAMMPAIAAQLVVLLKDTSFGALLAYEELLRRAQITGEFANNPLQALLVAALLYAPIVFLLNRLARRLERRRRQSPIQPLEQDVAVPAGVGPLIMS